MSMIVDVICFNAVFVCCLANPCSATKIMTVLSFISDTTGIDSVDVAFSKPIVILVLQGHWLNGICRLAGNEAGMLRKLMKMVVNFVNMSTCAKSFHSFNHNVIGSDRDANHVSYRNAAGYSTHH